MPNTAALLSTGEALWKLLWSGVASGVKTPDEGILVTKAIITAIHDVSSGSDSNVLGSIIRHHPAAIKIIEELASLVGGPMAGLGVEVLFTAMSASHGFPVGSPEEKAWFDRASGGPSAFS
jgi:hypothetical protein